MPSAAPETGKYAPPVGHPIASIIRFPTGDTAAVNVIRPKLCGGCAIRKICMPSDLNGTELRRFEDYVHTRRRIRAGQHLHHAGDACNSLHAVCSGFIRASIVSDDGREQVTGFHMMVEVTGIDMIGGGIHSTDAVAVEDTEVCEISLASLNSLTEDVPTLRRKLYQIIGEQLLHEREAVLLLGSMRAEDRVAPFLLNLGRRYEARGFSSLRFLLRMSRGDIGSYLGLRLETVSRLFSKFQAEGLLRVENKSVEILDPEGLKRVIGRSLN